MATVLTRAELDRMRRSIEPAARSDTETRRLALKRASEERMQKWPNTLQALRAKKANWKKEKEAKAEAARCEIDSHERALQKQQRMDSIQRANTLLYEQTDKMKTLRSQQLFADVMADREQQIREKRILREWEEQKERGWVDQLDRTMTEYDAKEESDRKRREETTKTISAVQAEQLEEYKQRYVQRLIAERREGELIKQKAADNLVEEQQAEAERRRRARVANEETRLANEQLKALKQEQANLELAEEEKRKSDAAKKEQLIAARSLQEQKRFAQRQALKQAMIDKACQQLEELKKRTDNREVRQAAERRAKEDAEEERRQQRRARQQAAIDRSRSMQLKMRADKAAAEHHANVELAHHWQQRNEQVAAEEKKENDWRRQRNIDVKNAQLLQVKERKQRAQEERALELLAEEQTRAVAEEDNLRYRQVAQEAIEEAVANGINSFPLKKAMAQKEITTMAAGGFRV